MPEPTAICGCDHGMTTGLALFAVRDRLITPLQQLQLPWYEATIWLEQLCAAWPAGSVLVAAERFVLSAGSIRVARGDENWTIEGIGCARRDARKFGHQFELKGASDAKKFVSDTHLRDVGWYRASKGGHTNDATRIAVLAAADELGIAPPWV